MEKKVSQYFKYANYSKEEYTFYKEEINLQNYRRFKVFSLINLFMSIIAFVLSFLFQILFNVHFIYLFIALLSILTFILNEYLMHHGQKYLYILYYIFVVGAFLSLGAAGINFNQAAPASVVCGVYIFLPILLLDLPYRFSLIMCICTMIVCIDSLLVKDFNYAILDCVNCLIFNCMGCILSYYFWDSRLTQIADRKTIAAQRDTDYLTGLGSRLAIESCVNSYLSQINESKKAALLLIDLDNFKMVNDKYGHLMGDKVLVMVSDILLNTFGSDSQISRIGGDEFVIFIPDVEREKDVLDKAQTTVEKIKNLSVRAEKIIGSSVGIVFTRAHEEYRCLFNDADMAMYHAKTAGKNQYKVYSDSSFRKDKINSEKSANEKD